MTKAYELRRRARATLGGKLFGSEWLYPLLVSLLISLVIGASGAASMAVLAFVLTGPLYIGLNKYYLELSRRNIKYDNLSIALDGFQGDVASNIITGILVTVFTALWTMLFIIPGIVKNLSYSMTYYIKAEHPEYNQTQAIDESRRIMNGHKMRLFLLRLSFIGWFILGALCFGVGTLWVAAYYKAAEAEFYRDLVGIGYIPPRFNDPNPDIFNR